MNDLSEWTKGHLCTSNVCYIVNGMMQYLAHLQSDIKSCKADFSDVGAHLSAAYDDMTQHNQNGLGLHFNHDSGSIRKGVKDLGMALEAFSHVVSDCHMQELAEIIEKLAEKLGIAPEVQWIEE